MRQLIVGVLRPLFFFLASHVRLDRWPYVFGVVYGIRIPGRVRKNPQPTAYGSANINIVILLLQRTLHLPGEIAECGVFRGATLAPLAWYCSEKGSHKTVYGFDSFEGFDPKELHAESGETMREKERESAEFAGSSVKAVQKKLAMVKAGQNVKLVKGFFADTLQQADNEKFCFVHLDCDLAAAYATCLPFFYERMVSGGIILFDEYNDPVYTDATSVIDGFFAGKPEEVRRIEVDNYIKYYIVRE